MTLTLIKNSDVSQFGYLVNDGKKQKTIVPNFIGIHRKLDFRMGEITVIPIGCIRKITKLEEAEMRWKLPSKFIPISE